MLSDQSWIRHVLVVAELVAEKAEVPESALPVLDGEPAGERYNRPIGEHDPSAHAEIRALRDAGQRLGNYRLPGTTL